MCKKLKWARNPEQLSFRQQGVQALDPDEEYRAGTCFDQIPFSRAADGDGEVPRSDAAGAKNRYFLH